jgi:hypothetical protein
VLPPWFLYSHATLHDPINKCGKRSFVFEYVAAHLNYRISSTINFLSKQICTRIVKVPLHYPIADIAPGGFIGSCWSIT